MVEVYSTLAEAACFCVYCWRMGGFASANFSGFGGGATLATGVVCVLGRGGFRWIRPPEIFMALTVWWRYIQRWQRRRVLALALSTGELSGGVVFRLGPRREIKAANLAWVRVWITGGSRKLTFGNGVKKSTIEALN